MLDVERIGRYEVLSHLASGGMGQVYLARSTGLGGFERQVVVKTLDLSITDDGDAFVTMFLDEARLVGALHHQYIAPVYEVGCDDEGRYYLVMDYVHGETTEAVFRASAERSLQVPLAFALTVVSCVASALDYAHGLCAEDGTPLDIVHRDISLSNVMVGYDGGVKLIDFGIAKAANRATKTQVGILKGKIGYLAPEQILRKHVDHRADIFSLGIVLYELTTAKRAFRRGSDLITLERITSGELRKPTEIVPGYPLELERIVLRALQVDPDRRFQDAGAMGRELEALAAQMGLRLGHAAVIDVMKTLFGDLRRGRRRTARGSNDVQTDPSIHVQPIIDDDDEKTPVVDLAVIEAMERENGSHQRAARPTRPLIDRSKRDVAAGTHGAGIEVPLEDLPTPPSERALEREPHGLIPLEDRPTSLAAPTIPDAAGQLLDRPTPPRVPHRRTPLPLAPPSPPRARVAEHTPSDAQPIREEVLPPVVIFRQPTTPSYGPTAMVARVGPAISKAARTWLFLCALFAIAVITAILVAVL